MERFIEETFGAKPLFEASRLVLEAQHEVEELRSRGATAQRRIGDLLAQLSEIAHLHHWHDEADVIATLEAQPVGNSVRLQRQLRIGMRQLERQLHDRLLAVVVTRLKDRRR
jgi:hypothetical protein